MWFRIRGLKSRFLLAAIEAHFSTGGWKEGDDSFNHSIIQNAPTDPVELAEMIEIQCTRMLLMDLRNKEGLVVEDVELRETREDESG